MGLRTVIESAGAQELVQIVIRSKLTAVLKVGRSHRTGQLDFVEGQLVGARTSCQQPLGKFLVEADFVREPDVALALRSGLQMRNPPPLGSILLALGFIDRKGLAEALRLQMERALAEILRWNVGVARMQLVAPTHPTNRLSVTMNTERLIEEIEGAQGLAEKLPIRTEFPAVPLPEQTDTRGEGRRVVKPGNGAPNIPVNPAAHAAPAARAHPTQATQPRKRTRRPVQSAESVGLRDTAPAPASAPAPAPTAPAVTTPPKAGLEPTPPPAPPPRKRVASRPKHPVEAAPVASARAAAPESETQESQDYQPMGLACLFDFDIDIDLSHLDPGGNSSSPNERRNG